MLAGAAAVLLVHAPAYAQKRGAQPAQPPSGAPARAAPPAPDGLAPDELYMEADRLERDDKAKRTIAEGNVEIRYQGRTLRADRVVYDEGAEGQRGVIHASGNVQIINADGTVEYAHELVTDDKMSAGAASGFSARLQQNAKIVASGLVRRSDIVQELDRAMYTPCPICVGDKPKTPTWSITGDRVVQDKKRHLIFYRNARVHIMNVPILWFPVFWHADPSANRASGLLAPKFGAANKRGFSYEQAYLWTATPSMDVIVSPQINTKVNPFLNAEVHKRFYSGEVDLRFGYTYERDFDSQGNKFGDLTNRSYILGRGSFRVDDNWLLGFTAERASDRLIFDKYDISNAFEARGPYVADDRRLLSSLYAIHQTADSYFQAGAISVQGLRASTTDPTQLENNRIFPTIAPLVEQRYTPDTDVLGGQLHITGSTVALTRSQSPDNPALPGIDSRRVTAEADWTRSFILPVGLRVDPFVNVRADAYSLGDVPTGVGLQVQSSSIGRGLATFGADISYPLYRRWRDATIVLEPLVQLAASPPTRQVIIGHDTTTGQPIFLDEDSASFEFDESNLFQADKFPGYDLYQGGARANVGGRASVLWDDGRRAVLLIGRAFNTQDNSIYLPGTGLGTHASDWIVYAEADPLKNVSFFTRAQLDGSTFEVHRLEVGANFRAKYISGWIRYFDQDAEQSGLAINSVTGALSNSITGQRQQNMDVGGELKLRKNWGVSFWGTRDFVQQAWVDSQASIFYTDDCIRVDLIYRREDVVIGRLGSSNQIALRLTLATLGRAINVR